MSTKGKILNQFEHVWKLPDTWIGSIQTVEEEVWIFDPEDEQPKLKKILFNNGLANIIRETTSNAIDNVWRSQANGCQMKNIKITVDKESGEISVWNDGYCIPVRKQEFEKNDHKTDEVTYITTYPAEVYFGEMLAGTNFEENEKRKTSGKNGMGAKTTNIFSTSFVIEHTNPEDKKKFTQVYKNHGKCQKPVIEKYTGKTGYTLVTFTPDYERFAFPDEENPGISDDFYSYLRLVAYEAAMLTGVNVTFNEEKIKIPSLERWSKIFYPNAKIMHFKTEFGDECVVVEKDVDDDDIFKDSELEHMSYVNGLRTRNGGIHVDAWKNAIFLPLAKALNERRGSKFKADTAALKSYFMFFVRIEIENPKFDSQTKDRMNGFEGEDGKLSKNYKLSGPGKKRTEWLQSIELQVKKMLKWNFVKELDRKLEAKKNFSSSKKETTKSADNPVFGSKYSKANKARPGCDLETTLVITEGNSAKAMADSGRNAIKDGHDTIGTLAMKGKFVNSTNEKLTQVREHKEVKMIVKVMKLVFGREVKGEYVESVDYSIPENLNTLRYKNIIILTDADDDGEHIKGLLTAFFWKYFPSLYKIGAIKSLSTSVVKVTFGKGKKAEELLFYTNPQFRNWKPPLGVKYTIKYHKGLGSIEPKDVHKYFQEPKLITYNTDEGSELSMTLGFNKDFADCRKVWITKTMIPQIKELDSNFEELVDTGKKNGEVKKELLGVLEDYEPNENLIYEGNMSLTQFVYDNLIIYHQAALFRAIPCIYDGFKETTRKIFYGMRMSKHAGAEIGVEKLAGEIASIAGYHHGILSLYDSITKMAQGFVDSNNVPLLVNAGQFGSRDDGGDETAAAARYIFSKLEKISDVLFPAIYDQILKHRIQDGDEVEFEHYMPVLPMILVNGADGIACGFSSKIPQHNILDIIEYTEHWIRNGTVDDLDDLVPWYRGFIGSIELQRKDDKVTGWISKGVLEEETKGKKSVWHVRELPIGVRTGVFKEHVEYLMTGNPSEGSKKKKREVKALNDYDDYSTINTVHFVLYPTKDFIPDMNIKDNMSLLIKKHSMNNMTVVDEKNFPYRAENTKDIINVFCRKKLEVTKAMKKYKLKELKTKYEKCSNRYKYIRAIVDKKLDLNQEGYEDVMRDDFKLKEFPSEEGKDDGYDYLLSMQTRSMTPAKLEALKKEKETTLEEFNTLKATSVEDIWLAELEEVKKAYKLFLKNRVEEYIVEKKDFKVKGKSKK